MTHIIISCSLRGSGISVSVSDSAIIRYGWATAKKKSTWLHRSGTMRGCGNKSPYPRGSEIVQPGGVGIRWTSNVGQVMRSKNRQKGQWNGRTNRSNHNKKGYTSPGKGVHLFRVEVLVGWKASRKWFLSLLSLCYWNILRTNKWLPVTVGNQAKNNSEGIMKADGEEKALLNRESFCTRTDVLCILFFVI